MTDTATPAPVLGEADQQAAGKANVRRLLIEPLETAGLRRPHGVSVDAQRNRLALIVDRLAYMATDNLDTLRDVVLTHAASALGRGEWPAPVVVEAWAQGLQPRPFRESHIVQSWLASVEGPPARAAGHHVQLYRLLRRAPRPPGPHDQRQIREQAARDRATRAVYAERVEKGVATADERAWLEAFARDEAAVLAIIAEGEARRAAKAAQAAREQGEAA